MPAKRKGKGVTVAALREACRDRWPIIIAWVLVSAGTIGLLSMAVPRLQSARIAPADLAVTFEQAPTWIDRSLLADLRRVVRTRLAGRPLTRGGLVRAAADLRATGYFDSVEQVAWGSGPSALVHAEFLVPYARIMRGDDAWFVDPVGRVLPRHDGQFVDPRYHFITFSGARHNPPQHPGERWPGADVAAALRLLREIYDKPWAVDVVGIDLGAWSDSADLVLLTNTPCRIVWGSAPGQERSLEALVSQKLQRLDHLHVEYGRIDQGRGGELDLTDVRVVTRR